MNEEINFFIFYFLLLDYPFFCEMVFTVASGLFENVFPLKNTVHNFLNILLVENF